MAGKALVTGKPQGHGHVERGIIAKKTIEGSFLKSRGQS
jgi:hypothetical protein